MRSMHSTRLALFAALSLLAAAVLAAPAWAAPKPGLDRSYGEAGVASLDALAEGIFRSSSLSQFAPVADGSTYALATNTSCGFDSCQQFGALYRVDAAGHLDTGFGGAGSVTLSPSGGSYALMADSKGGAIVARIEPDRRSVVLTRFEASGIPDGSFGTAGAVVLPCGCKEGEAMLTPGRHGRTVVVLQELHDGAGESGSRVTLARLGADGKPDAGFGRHGVVRIGLGSRGPATSLAVTRKGAILLGNVECCQGSRPYIVRVAAGGALDTRFGRTVGRSLRRLSKLGEFPELISLAPRPNGTLDVIGSSELTRSFDLRLRRNGQLAKFGKNGLVTLPFTVESAVLGTGGAIFAVGRREGLSGYRAFRILGNGKLDPGFDGGGGLRVPLAGEGIVASSLGGGRAVVTDLGYHECREGCPATPGIARFLEGPSRR